jgi:hypothetical protein
VYLLVGALNAQCFWGSLRPMADSPNKRDLRNFSSPTTHPTTYSKHPKAMVLLQAISLNRGCRSLFPYIYETRGRSGRHGEAIVFLDGSTCHGTDFLLNECMYIGVIPLLLPLHSSDQMQLLNPETFGIQESEASKLQLSAHLTDKRNR